MTPTSDGQEDEALSSVIENIFRLTLENHFSDNGWNSNESDTSFEISRNNSLLASLTLPQIGFFKTNEEGQISEQAPQAFIINQFQGYHHHL